MDTTNINLITKESLISALFEGDLDFVKEYLDYHANNINIPLNEDGETLLMIAAKFRKVNILKFLISKHADLDIADAKGNTALHKVIPVFNIGKLRINAIEEASSPEMCKILIESGANKNAINLFGETPLILATKFANVVYYENVNDYNQIVQILCDAKADLDIVDKTSFSALICSAANNNKENVHKLLSSGCNVYRDLEAAFKKINFNIGKVSRINRVNQYSEIFRVVTVFLRYEKKQILRELVDLLGFMQDGTSAKEEILRYIKILVDTNSKLDEKFKYITNSALILKNVDFMPIHPIDNISMVLNTAKYLVSRISDDNAQEIFNDLELYKNQTAPKPKNKNR